MNVPRPWAVGFWLLGIAACSGGRESAATPQGSAAQPPPARVREAYITPLDTAANIDSPALYHGARGEHWLIATAKEADVLVVYDAATGRELRRVGGTGNAAGKLDRPNGILVLDDSLLLVVERDNRRVQAFRLPSFAPLGTFGERELRLPYGIASYRDGAAYVVYVTDNYEMPDEQVPPLRELGARVKQYRVSASAGGLVARLVRAFGDTTDAGALRVVESIHVDVATDSGRVMVAEELETDSYVKVYSLDGRFLGRTMGRGRFPQQAEGLALYACGDTAGYWIATDQGPTVNTFHLFDRRTLEHVASFSGHVANTTDGVAFTQRAFGPFPAGAFFGSHFDGGVAAFSWKDIADATGARQDCHQ